MPVYKFKTFEEAEQALWCFRPDARYFADVRALFSMADRLHPSTAPKGLQKFKTLQEAEASRNAPSLPLPPSS